jgi:hypothetical protein
MSNMILNISDEHWKNLFSSIKRDHNEGKKTPFDSEAIFDIIMFYNRISLSSALNPNTKKNITDELFGVLKQKMEAILRLKKTNNRGTRYRYLGDSSSNALSLALKVFQQLNIKKIKKMFEEIENASNVKNTEGDGNCLFNAVVQSMLGLDKHKNTNEIRKEAQKLRKKAVDFMRKKLEARNHLEHVILKPHLEFGERAQIIINKKAEGINLTNQENTNLRNYEQNHEIFGNANTVDRLLNRLGCNGIWAHQLFLQFVAQVTQSCIVIFSYFNGVGSFVGVYFPFYNNNEDVRMKIEAQINNFPNNQRNLIFLRNDNNIHYQSLKIKENQRANSLSSVRKHLEESFDQWTASAPKKNTDHNQNTRPQSSQTGSENTRPQKKPRTNQ